MKKREEIPAEYKWEIDLFSDPKEIEDCLKLIDEFTKKVQTYNGKFGNADCFFDYYYSNEKTLEKIQQLSFFISNSLSINDADIEILKLSERFDSAMNKFEKATSFVEPQLQALDLEYLKALLKDDRSKDISNIIDDLIKHKKHSIDEKTSEVIAKISNSLSNSSSVFDTLSTSEMYFEKAKDKDGNLHEVNPGEYSKLSHSQDRILRKNAFSNMMNGYGKLNKTITSLYLSSLKQDHDFSLLYNYNSTLEKVLSSQDVPIDVFYKNIEKVRENKQILQDYAKTKSKDMHIKDFSIFDLSVPLNDTKKYTIEEGKSLAISALKPLGEEYLEKVKTELKNHSIDYLPHENKWAGGYCSDCFVAKTLILMNWTDNYDSASTLVHEIGHAVNAMYYNENQPFHKAGITIFAAEIASTVNEILLNHYFLNTTSGTEKKIHLQHLFGNVIGTIFTQTYYSEFEQYAHDCIEKDIPISFKELNDKFFELASFYLAPACIVPKEYQYHWSRVPHFYTPFYVFCYSTGLISAICIANRILKNPSYSSKYIEFLKNGTSKPAYLALKEIGIDLASDQPYDEAFDYIKQCLNDYQSICK